MPAMHTFGRSDVSARVKPAKVAGTFHRGDGEALRREIDGRLGRARAGGSAPKAPIAPYAGVAVPARSPIPHHAT